MCYNYVRRIIKPGARWFLEIAFVWEIGMHVCVCVCVCVCVVCVCPPPA